MRGVATVPSPVQHPGNLSTTPRHSKYRKKTDKTEEPLTHRDRSNGLILGHDIQLGDWVNIKNPNPGQPDNGKVIGKTLDNLVRVERKVIVVKREETVVVRRHLKNLNVIEKVQI